MLCRQDGCWTDDCSCLSFHDFYRATFTAGYRYLDLEDNLTINERLTTNQGFLVNSTNTGVETGTQAFAVTDAFGTRNWFNGGEVGMRFELQRNRWGLELFPRIAIGDTHSTVTIAGQTITTDSVGNETTRAGGLLAQPTNIGQYVRDDFSVVPEFDLTMSYQVTPHAKIVLGYSFLYWTNVAASRPADRHQRRCGERAEFACLYPADGRHQSAIHVCGDRILGPGLECGSGLPVVMNLRPRFCRWISRSRTVSPLPPGEGQGVRALSRQTKRSSASPHSSPFPKGEGKNRSVSMSKHSHKATSWFSRLSEVFAPRPGHPLAGRRACGNNRRSLRLESLETRSLLSATVLPTISGIVYQDTAGAGVVVAGDPTVANVTVNLFRDGGDGIFEGMAPGDDSLVATATTNLNGQYSFPNVSIGTYFVQEIGVPGLIVPSGAGVQKVVVTSADTQGAMDTTIDSFASTSQYVSGSLHGSRTGTSAMSTPDAIGGHRSLYVQLTTFGGGVSLGADSDWPGMLDFGANAASNGVFWVNWDGNNSNAAVLNPTGLGQIDLTSQGAATGITLAAGIDHDNGQLTFKVYTDAGDWSWATVTIPDTNDGSLGESTFVPFSSFNVGGGAGANFTRVGAIQLSISGLNAADGEVGPIATAGPMVLTANLANTPQADLSVLKTAQPNPATAGGQITYTFTTADNGPANATGVTLSDVLPAGETYVSSTTSQGTVRTTTARSPSISAIWPTVGPPPQRWSSPSARP